MDPKRKRIYIIIIAVCLILTGILVWKNFGTTPPSDSIGTPITTPGNISTTPAAAQASGNISSGFKAPDVFPATDVFHTEVLESPNFKKLNEYSSVDVTDQLGRPDPFKNY